MKLAARDIPRDRIVRRTPRGAVLRLPRADMLAIWCAECELVSTHPSDVEFGYCGHCCKFHRDFPAPAPPEAA